jgi:hypothetical protein
MVTPLGKSSPEPLTVTIVRSGPLAGENPVIVREAQRPARILPPPDTTARRAPDARRSSEPTRRQAHVSCGRLHPASERISQMSTVESAPLRCSSSITSLLPLSSQCNHSAPVSRARAKLRSCHCAGSTETSRGSVGSDELRCRNTPFSGAIPARRRTAIASWGAAPDRSHGARPAAGESTPPRRSSPHCRCSRRLADTAG